MDIVENKGMPSLTTSFYERVMLPKKNLTIWVYNPASWQCVLLILFKCVGTINREAKNEKGKNRKEVQREGQKTEIW
jgi:hypothetical protein